MMEQTIYSSVNNLPLALCVTDLMSILGVGRNKAYELVRSGQIRSVKIGRKYCIPREAIAEFLAASVPAA